jgi:Na+-translocating ferredoxin:NAD+ oxidoreductase RnfC subunit
MTYSPKQITAAVRQGGIIGAGGGGFPTHVKLQAKVDTVIANGSECEPLLCSDRTMMVQKPKLLIDGLKIAMQATGAQQGIIALKKHYKDAVAALTKVLPKNGSIKLQLLDNFYPAGDEFILVYEVTKKIIPEGGIPLHVGVVVNNVITLMQVALAMHGKPVTERTVTLAGEFREPKVVTVPIGTSYADLVKIGNGFNMAAEDIVLIDGGPMMGKLVTDPKAGISKTTSGILALPKDHCIIEMATKTISQMLKRSKSACCQCFRCSDLCPRNLIGHKLFPHMTMRTIDYNQAEPTDHITSAFLCSQCGMCELIACDIMRLSPRKIYAAYRKELVAQGVKNPHTQINLQPNSQYEYRKIAIPTLLKKLDLMRYDGEFPYTGLIGGVQQVRIPLNKHIGVPAIPQVALGQKVKMCDIIAASPKDKLGTIYHASLTGKITDVNNEFIEISVL